MFKKDKLKNDKLKNDKLKNDVKIVGGLMAFYALAYVCLMPVTKEGFQVSDHNRAAYKSFCQNDFQILTLEKQTKNKSQFQTVEFTQKEACQIRLFLLDKNIVVRDFLK